MRDEKLVQQRLEELRGQFLQCGTPELRVFVATRDELRGWIRALEWVLGKIGSVQLGDTARSLAGSV